MGTAPRRPRARGRIPAWLPLGIVLVGVLSLLHRLDREAHSRGVARIDLSRYRLHAGDRWVSDVWLRAIERTLLRRGELEADDGEGIEGLVEELRSLSFVAEVGEVEVDWPDGLNIPLRLRQPVACLRVGDDFLPVAADGTVLSGYAYAPHPDGSGGYLPALGRGLGGREDELPAPGDVLRDPALLDALAVARSLAAFLGPLARERLGRSVIDASSESAYDGLPGGVVIDLEGARRIHFGRPPGGGEPGERPLADKWASVDGALQRWAAGEDFDAFDARWDAPKELRLDGGEPAR